MYFQYTQRATMNAGQSFFTRRPSLRRRAVDSLKFRSTGFYAIIGYYFYRFASGTGRNINSKNESSQLKNRISNIKTVDFSDPSFFNYTKTISPLSVVPSKAFNQRYAANWTGYSSFQSSYLKFLSRKIE
eukprot:TRINITY_DN1701_c0_g1_i1.p1 TRINITY_DN1701_c0_g1~~TRINITY_DN1701_c0_g1_i1.p1  ORF type:complete len:130 (+),score=13.17 TRINITY_DN1701_c0_g1_i1:216-605(+)